MTEKEYKKRIDNIHNKYKILMSGQSSGDYMLLLQKGKNKELESLTKFYQEQK